MNFQGAFCYHEGINGCTSTDEYKQKLNNGKGDSLTAGTLIDIPTLFPDAPIVIIDSLINRTVDFAYQMHGVDTTDYFVDMKKKLDNIDGLHIDIDDIDNRLPDIWHHLQDGDYDEEKAEIIKKLNIQVIDPFDVDYDSLKILLENVSCH